MKKTQGVWARVYSGGLALVNPYVNGNSHFADRLVR